VIGTFIGYMLESSLPKSEIVELQLPLSLRWKLSDSGVFDIELI
jgi:hypothetical protein